MPDSNVPAVNVPASNLPVALTIAGSDPSGGAGIQADLKTFHRFGVYGSSVLTLVTVQNTLRVSRVELIGADLVREQMEAVFEDLGPTAAKTGALGSPEIIDTVAAVLVAHTCLLVVDPVMVSKHATPLLGRDALEALRRRLVPLATLVTPNLPEAGELAAMEVSALDDMHEAARRIAGFGCQSVLVKGGHLPDGSDAVDLLLHDGHFEQFRSPRMPTRHTHGTGCTYSAAITALLAKGHQVPAAVATAKQFIHNAIATAPGLGGGSGPVNHWAVFDEPV